MNQPAKLGRPTKFTPEVADEIIERQAKGEPLSRICEDAHIPAFSTVARWETQDADFRALSTWARKIGTHFLAGDCIRIADDPKLDPADKRVRIDTRLRLIGKWNRKGYGDSVEHRGSVEEPVRLLVDAPQRIDPRRLDPEQRQVLRQVVEDFMARLKNPDVG